MTTNNTPTPAQALGDIGHWLCKYSDDGRYMNLNGPSSRQCFAVGQELIKHGQHFAGLEAARDECERQFQAKVEEVIREMCRAEAAEARVREADGLLRHWQAWICGPSELHKATAAFLAANGETK